MFCRRLDTTSNELFRTPIDQERIISSFPTFETDGNSRGKEKYWTELNTVLILGKVDHSAEASVFVRVSAIGFFW